MQRVAVVGNSGSGKTTLGRRLAEHLDAPHLELDSLQHQPSWTPMPAGEMRRRVSAFVQGDRWVVDGNYSRVRDIVWSRADTVVWLDLPRRVVMSRVTRRTIGRWLYRTELWNGNRESARNWLSWDPDRSVIRWAWVQHREYRQMYMAARTEPEWSRLHFVQLTSAAAVDRWLASLDTSPALR